jgi:hypothetical protein
MRVPVRPPVPRSITTDHTYLRLPGPANRLHLPIRSIVRPLQAHDDVGESLDLLLERSHLLLEPNYLAFG